MSYFKVGCNFDLRLIDGMVELNTISSNSKVKEFYGSDRRHASLAARPAFRLPDVEERYIENYVKRCNAAGIEFNYTLNSMYPGSKRTITSNKREIIDFVQFLDGIGVKTVTVTNPILAGLVREASETIGLEVSTIAHIDAVTQIKAWKHRFGITAVCSNLLKNRSIRFLKSASSYCNESGIVLNLMVNEFCAIGGNEGAKTYTTHCIYRDSCYLCHSENESIEDDQLLDRYPMGYCIPSRNDKSSWLKALFIRPEDIRLYHGLGINHFKVTGRTGTTQYILGTTEAYVRRSWDGNLLALWKPLETILSGESELEFSHCHEIDNKKLEGFLSYWFDNQLHECANEVCGETCDYCNAFCKQAL